jgi:26S proteasome regulatory subunit N5
MNENVQILSKKHGQLKLAITKMVQLVMKFLPETPTIETKLSVIDALRTVTEGKVSVPAAKLEASTDPPFRSLSKSSEPA